MPHIKVMKPVMVHLDEDGFMRYPSEWDENVMRKLADYHNVKVLEDKHVDFIFQIRELASDYDGEDLQDEYCRRFDKKPLEVIIMYSGMRVLFDKVCAIAGIKNFKDIKKQRLALEKEKAKAELREKLKQEKKDRIGVDIDEDGFLMDMDDWSEKVACRLAREEGIEGELGEDRWNMIYFVRTYFLKFGKAPMIRKFCKESKFSLQYTIQLFPAGVAKGLCKVAGLPQPPKCKI